MMDLESGVRAQHHQRRDSDEDSDVLILSQRALCGLCLVGHTLLRLVVAHVWFLELPLIALEAWVIFTVLRYLRSILARDAVTVASGFILGWGLGYAVFAPLAKTGGYDSVCTLYLSTLAWFAAHLCVYLLVSVGVAKFVGVTTGPFGCCENQIRHLAWVTPGSEEAYLGLFIGLFLVFGDVAFDPRLGPYDWGYCRASAAWPAEAVYIPVFVLGCVAQLVFIWGHPPRHSHFDEL